MPEKELFWRRPKNYSIWHRPPNLPKRCYLTDGDFFEQRVINGKLTAIAYFETAETEGIERILLDLEWGRKYLPWPSKRALMKEIGEKMRIPTYFVVNNPECTDFLVWGDLEKPPKRMGEAEYKEFIKNLSTDRVSESSKNFVSGEAMPHRTEVSESTVADLG